GRRLVADRVGRRRVAGKKALRPPRGGDFDFLFGFRPFAGRGRDRHRAARGDFGGRRVPAFGRDGAGAGAPRDRRRVVDDFRGQLDARAGLHARRGVFDGDGRLGRGRDFDRDRRHLRAFREPARGVGGREREAVGAREPCGRGVGDLAFAVDRPDASVRGAGGDLVGRFVAVFERFGGQGDRLGDTRRGFGGLGLRVEARYDRRRGRVDRHVRFARFLDEAERVDVLAQPVFTWEHVRDVHPLQRERGVVDVAPANRDALEEA